MTEYLKLTTYFGERRRTGGQFLGEAILDLLAERRVAHSVLLRGVTGFGGRHRFRSDASLTLSEDPPVTIAALDSAEVMTGVADEVIALMPRGLITLERSRLIISAATDFTVSHDDEIRLTIPLDRNRRIDGTPAFAAACELLSHHGFAGATTFLGVDGTADGVRRRARFFSRNLDIPLMVVAVGTVEQTRAALPELRALLGGALFTTERARVCKRDGSLLRRPGALPKVDAGGRPLWQKLTVQTSEDTRRNGIPIHRILVRKLLKSGSARGATVLRGVFGFTGDQKPRGDRVFQCGRQVPVSTVVIDSPENVARIFDIIDTATTETGLVTCETVPALLALDGTEHGGVLELAVPPY
ncbi:MAG: DUF190 domain-containing protein [Mycobacterium sp.]